MCLGDLIYIYQLCFFNIFSLDNKRGIDNVLVICIFGFVSVEYFKYFFIKQYFILLQIYILE